MLSQNLAHNIEPARQRCIAKGLFGSVRPIPPNSRDQRLLRVDEFALGLRKRRGQRADRGTKLLHDRCPTKGSSSGLAGMEEIGCCCIARENSRTALNIGGKFLARRPGHRRLLTGGARIKSHQTGLFVCGLDPSLNSFRRDFYLVSSLLQPGRASWYRSASTCGNYPTHEVQCLRIKGLRRRPTVHRGDRQT